MIESDKFWGLVKHFLDVIHAETGFPVLIYDTSGFIIQATDVTRIGHLHAGAEKIMQGRAGEYSVTKEEANQNPLVREGHSCPIFVDNEIKAGFGITGKLELARPLAKIAANMISSWIEVYNFQEQLARSERRYRSVFDHSMHGIFQASPEGKLLLVNKAAADILGYPSPDILSTSVIDAATQLYSDAQDRAKFLEVVQREGRISKFVTRFTKFGGEVIDVSINATLLNDLDTGEPYIQGLVEDITDIKRAEEAIRQSEEKYAKAFNNSPIWVVLSSLVTGRLIEVNETYLRTTGYDRDEVIGRTSSELGTWANREDREHAVRQIEKHGRVHDFEVRRKTKDGRILTMLFYAELIDIGDESCMLSASLDITDRKLMEEELRNSENNLRITLNSIGDAVIATNTKSIITRMNPMAEKLTGWSANEAVGMPLPDVFRIYNALSGQKELNPAEKVLIHGEIVDLANHTVLIDKDGNNYQIADSGAPIRDSKGKIEGVVLVFRDVTESYQQAQKIKENERLLNNLTANIPGVVFQIQVGAEKRFIMNYVSQKFLNYFGIDPYGDDLFLQFSDHIAAEDKGAFLKSISLAARGSTPWQYEGRYIKPDGDTIWFSGSAIPQRVKDKVIFYGVLLDITSRKQAENDAERLEAALAQAQKMEAIGALAGGIAHDFNNILTAVVGYSQLSLMQKELNTTLRDNLSHIHNAGIRARDLVAQILTFSRQKKLELIPLQMGPLVKESLKLLRASLPATIEIEEFIDSDLANVMADPTQIHQIIMNLSTNAAQAIEDNIGSISIRLNQVRLQKGELPASPEQRPGTYIKLEIKDSGKGIEADNLNRIFEPYFTTKGFEQGTGLGLSVVHGIVKEYNGTIEVASSTGSGTTFSIYLPAVKRRGGSIQEQLKPIPTGNETILLVDDELDVLDVGRQMLENLGYTVFTCCDGFEALKRYNSSPDSINLVISDLTMPRMSGTELASKLHKINRALPIIFWSGYSSTLADSKMRTEKAKGFLIKPILPSELGNLVRKVLDENT